MAATPTISTLTSGPAILTTLITQLTAGPVISVLSFRTTEYSTYLSAQEAQRLFNLNIAAVILGAAGVGNVYYASWISQK